MKLRNPTLWAAVVFGLTICMSGNALATNSEDDCFFAWAEQSYPEFIAPAGAISENLSPYYYRFYSQTNSYLGINSENQHLYYLTGDTLLDLGPYSIWKSQSVCAAPGSAEDVRAMIDRAVALPDAVTDSGVTDQLEPLLGGLLGAQSTCPTTTTNLDLSGLSSLEDLPAFLASLPNPISVQVSYGSGCTTETGSTMSGMAGLTVSNFNINNETGNVSALFEMVMNQLQQDGELLANGKISGEIDINSTNMTGTAYIEFDNFQAANAEVLNGSITLTLASATEFYVDTDISEGTGMHAKISLSVVTPAEGIVVINTLETGSLNQYDVNFNNLTFDESLCSDYPVSGSVNFTSDGQSWIATFNSSCDGTYDLR